VKLATDIFARMLPLLHDTLVNFKGGIGVDPVSGIASGAPVTNLVCGVTPAAFPGGSAVVVSGVLTRGGMVLIAS
jgi:hypothetical protein